MKNIKTWQERKDPDSGWFKDPAWMQQEIDEWRAEMQILIAERDLYRQGCDFRDAELDKDKSQW